MRNSLAALLIVATVCPTVFAGQLPSSSIGAPPNRVRQELLKQERNARVVVSLRNNETVEGHLATLGATSFVVTHRVTKAPTQIPYRNVKRINAAMSNGERMVLTVVTIAAVTVAFIALKASGH